MTEAPIRKARPRSERGAVPAATRFPAIKLCTNATGFKNILGKLRMCNFYNDSIIFALMFFPDSRPISRRTLPPEPARGCIFPCGQALHPFRPAPDIGVGVQRQMRLLRVKQRWADGEI